MMVACNVQNQPPERLTVVSAPEIPGSITFGSDSSSGVNAVLGSVIDATFLDRDEIAVLDRYAPFVRVYGRDGAFVRAIVPEGGGPGEARHPVSLQGTDSGAVLLTESNSVSLISADGKLIRRLPPLEGRSRGAAIGCDGQLLVMHTVAQGYLPTGAITAFDSTWKHPVSEFRLDTIRGFSRQEHPFFLVRSKDVLTFYTEEIREPRLLSITCGPESVTSLPLPPPGRAEWFEQTSGGWALHPSDPPIPAGVAAVDNGVLWATNELIDSDKATVLTLIGSDGSVGESLGLRGWVELVDSDDRAFLFIHRGDSASTALVVPRGPLLRLVAQLGIERRKRKSSQSVSLETSRRTPASQL